MSRRERLGVWTLYSGLLALLVVFGIAAAAAISRPARCPAPRTVPPAVRT